MREYQGVVRTLGEGSSERSLNVGANRVTTYSYIEVGDEIVKKAKAYSGMAGELSAALRRGDPVTVYMQGRYVVGVKNAEGRTFASAGDNMLLNFILLVSCLLFGVPFSFLIIGIPALFVAWQIWGRISAGLAARSLPNAILI